MTTPSATAALSGAPAPAPAAAPVPAPAAPVAAPVPGAAAPSPTPAPSGDGEWFSGIQSPEVKTWVQAKGFKDPLAVAESAFNLEKLMGFDRAGKTVTIPDENSSPETVAAFRQKMGVPANAEGYQLPVPTGGDPAFAKTAAQWFLENGVPAGAAAKIVEKYNTFAAEQSAASEQSYLTGTEQEFAALKTEWGQAYDAYTELARRATLQFIPGDDAARAATLAKMERAIGTATMMKLFQAVGQGLGEAKFRQGDGGSGVMTPAAAQQRIAELKSNKDWTSAYLNGDAAKKTEMQQLHAMAYPEVG